MQISLRSQMIAGTTAIVGATAIAMTPVAPAMNLPALSTSNAAVSLAALNNPLGALLNTALVLGNYTLNGAYTTPAVNWPGSGTNDYTDGIGPVINSLVIPSLGVVTPGLLPNIIATPFPALTTLATNWLGYAYIGAESLLSAAGNISDIVWTIPATAVQVLVDLVTNPSQIVPDIQAAIQAILFSAQEAVNDLIGGATTIVSSVVTKGQAVVQFLLEEASTLAQIIPGQIGLLVNSVSGVVSNVVTGFSSPNPIEGVWNAVVDGLLDATVSGSVPATVINLTYGAGVQFGPIVSPDPSVAPFVPSVRTTGTALVNGVADALNTPVPSAASARKAAAPAAAAAVAAAPAAEATAGDNDSAAAEEATTAAPAASAAADDSTSSDAPKKASKAGAARAGR